MNTVEIEHAINRKAEAIKRIAICKRAISDDEKITAETHAAWEVRHAKMRITANKKTIHVTEMIERDGW